MQLRLSSKLHQNRVSGTNHSTGLSTALLAVSSRLLANRGPIIAADFTSSAGVFMVNEIVI
jgi:hypothetical protein